jgi:diadenosine tetraphosphate (Ap4A) HIT family hydrolase
MKFYRSSDQYDDCSICRELLGRADSLFARLFSADGIVSAAAENTSHFAVLPSIGPLAPGHSLIVSKSHQPNILMYAKRENLVDELDQIFCSHIARLSSRFSRHFLAFEHASNNACHNLCSTSHAHLHIVPLSERSIWSVLTKIQYTADALSMDELAAAAEFTEDFVYVRYFADGKFLQTNYFLHATHLPSQFMRQIIASVVGLEKWNWKENPAVELMRETIECDFKIRRLSLTEPV